MNGRRVFVLLNIQRLLSEGPCHYQPGKFKQVNVSEFVSWCFKPSQPQNCISGLRKTFIKRYIVERTNKSEIRLEEQSEKAES